MRPAPCPFLLQFFFCDAAEPNCVVVVLVIPWHGKVNKVNDWTLTDRAWGDHFRPHYSIRQMLKVAFEAVEVFWPVCGSYSPCADIWTPSRPPHRHGIRKPSDFGSLLFFFLCVCAFSAFSKIFGSTLEKIQILWCDWAWSRNLPQPGRRHFEAHLALCCDRALPPPFFFGGTQHPLVLPWTKKRTILVMHHVISKNLQSDFAAMHRCVKSRQSQVAFARGSAAESSALIPRYHKILILCINRMVLFFVQGSTCMLTETDSPRAEIALFFLCLQVSFFCIASRACAPRKECT